MVHISTFGKMVRQQGDWCAGGGGGGGAEGGGVGGASE